VNIYDRLWTPLRDALFGASSAGQAEASLASERARGQAPVVWLLGKTGSGKTSIVAALTGAERAEIGEGFLPCTRTANFFDFPPEAPLVRFLDTRGLGEANYDPTEDITWCEGQSHLILVVVRVDDPVQGEILSIVQAARRRHPEWPVIVAQTSLHKLLLPDLPHHPDPDSFTGGPEDTRLETIPHRLRQALVYQRDLFAKLPGSGSLRFVPLDFTRPEDGFPVSDFGLDRLWDALEAAVPEAARALREGQMTTDAIARRSRALIWGYAVAAAGTGAVPVPVLGMSGLAATQALMLRALAARYGIEWTTARAGAFTGAIGTGVLTGLAVRYGLRELVKLVPVVGTWAGGAMNAASASAITLGLGRAACVFLDAIRKGDKAQQEEIRNAFAEGVRQAAEELRRRRPIKT
jgi:uncharacterized protein (DUF697 family)